MQKNIVTVLYEQRLFITVKQKVPNKTCDITQRDTARISIWSSLIHLLPNAN